MQYDRWPFISIMFSNTFKRFLSSIYGQKGDCYDGAVNGHEKCNCLFALYHIIMLRSINWFAYLASYLKQEWKSFNYSELRSCISERLGKIPLLCQSLDPLNGMANCPGYHGYERVCEHINHEDLGFFLFYFPK